jgi:hypothetical protein
MGHIGRMQKSISAIETFIPPHGGYAGLLAYQKALIVYQGTPRFCKSFLEKRDRTVDQMVQAARPGSKILPKQARLQALPRKRK